MTVIAPARSVDAALFDWDGTLVDSREALLAAWHESTEAVLGRRYPATAARGGRHLHPPGHEDLGRHRP